MRAGERRASGQVRSRRGEASGRISVWCARRDERVRLGQPEGAPREHTHSTRGGRAPPPIRRRHAGAPTTTHQEMQLLARTVSKSETRRAHQTEDRHA